VNDRGGLFVFNHMSKTIFRVNRKSHFTTIPNTTVRDKTLSFRARGILALLLSNTEDWVVHKSWIVEQGTEGKEAIAAALRELESKGYATYAELREKGQFVGAQWTFHDEPVAEEKRTNYRGKYPARKKRVRHYTKTSPMSGNPEVGHPDVGKPAAKNTIGKEDHQKEEEGEISSSLKINKEKASPKIPDSRKSDAPDKEKLLPVLERWREVYEIVQGSPYVESRKDMEALSHLLHRWPDADQLAGVIESAFLLVGHPKAWTCNNRMETIDAFAVNIAKIMGEVKKHAVQHEATYRMELARRERLWANMQERALLFMQRKFGKNLTVTASVLEFLRGHEAIEEVPPYFRCVNCDGDPEVMAAHGDAAREALDDANMEGFVEFLQFRGWWMDLSPYERGR